MHRTGEADVVKFRYSKVPVQNPVHPQGGVYYRFRPILEVGLADSDGTFRFIKCTLDSGSDDTIFPLSLADSLHIVLTEAPTGKSTAVGGKKFEYPYAEVVLLLSDGVEVAIWNAIVGFSDARTTRGLLGQSGTFEYFDVNFLGFTGGITVVPNDSFSGQWLDRS